MVQKYLCILLAVATYGQVQFTVQTDTTVYSVGAPVEITGRVTNISGETVTLNWPTGCQFNYYLGSWGSYESHGCTLALTWITLEPAMSHSWEYIHNPEDTTFEEGSYAIVGSLYNEEFRLTPPVFITIGDVETDYYKIGYAPPADSMLLVNGGCTPVVLVPVVEHISDDLDLVRINTTDNSWYVYKPVDPYAINPYPWGATDFYFYIRDSLDYSYELFLLHEWEDFALDFDQENYLWVDGDCTYRLILSHENVAVDSIDYAFKARMTASIDPGVVIPAIVNVEAYPSPFNPMTTIAFELLQRADVVVNVFNLAGRRVWSTRILRSEPGHHELEWQGQDQGGVGVPSGIYIIQVETGRFNESIKVVMLK
ncbi:MAG: T9SS type A sorting domain-containing protein [Candidatus Marinimicrobia bacterium]|nr:T9SS type A sorting domain-containing protein [Candidatus Neomarinimicrobiota bacterium]MCF7921770.1 T9SS type A sorting domain-containing protein [Candidatus Neomarinimicrobiota bacterium]